MKTRKASYEYVDYNAALLAHNTKYAHMYVDAFKKLLETNGWTEEEYLEKQSNATN